MDWKEYQEEVAEFFRSIGLDAETDVTLQGVRTKHDIDVLVKSHHVGFDITWIVECKYWKSKVSKLHVLALREIVSDTGVDRGILLAENGFQSGAIEAAALTNVHVKSLAEVANTASTEIFSMRIRELYDRIIWCKIEYWDIPKDRRIECGLRQELGTVGYYGDWAIKIAEDLLFKAFRNIYPIVPDEMHAIASQSSISAKLPQEIKSDKELVDILEPLIAELEKKINDCKYGKKNEA